MQLAVLAGSRAEAEALCLRIRKLRSGAEPAPFSARESFFSAFQTGAYCGAVIALGDSAGFLAARRLRDLDRDCRILMIDDTDRYALQCVRIHVVDFLLRPVPDDRLERGVKLLLR